MNLVTHLANRAKEHPERPALIDAKQSISYQDLYAHVCGASTQLQGDGLKPNDTLLILQSVSIDLYVTLLGAFHAGLTVMFIDPSAGNKMLSNSLKLHQPNALIGSSKAHLLRLTIPAIRKIPRHYHSSGWVPFSKKWQPKKSTDVEPIETTSDSPALITFTSGSTGMPKAACRTHGFLLAQHEALADSLHYCEGEVDLVTLPIFALANLASGLTSVIADTDLRFPARAESTSILQQCTQHHITRCAASPAFFTRLHRDQKMPPFQSIYTGGAPVFPNLIDEIHAAHPEMNIVTVYGSTEAEPIAHISWSDVDDIDHQMMSEGKGLLVGKAVDATELRIITDQSGQAIPPITHQELQSLPEGKIGEIIVTGQHVLKGYLHGKGDEENKINVDGKVWHRTGDAGWMDQDGRVWLMGRASAKIQLNEKSLYPFGVECAAMSHPEVERCALIFFENQVTLFIEGPDNKRLRTQLLEKLKELSVESIRFTPLIPVDKRHNAKIDYSELQKLVE